MRHTFHFFLVLLLGGLAACDSLAFGPESRSIPDVSPSSSASPESSPSASPNQQLAVSSATIQVEGTRVELSLNLFDEPEVPFTTYVPAGDFVNDIVSTDAGTSVAFYSNLGGQVNQSAYVRVFLPKRSTGLKDIQEEVLGDQGLLAQNNWQITDRTDVVVYPWAKEQIMFRSGAPDQSTAGQIFIGEHNDRVFYIVMHYPIEYAEGFEPRATVILDELRFRQ